MTGWWPADAAAVERRPGPVTSDPAVPGPPAFRELYHVLQWAHGPIGGWPAETPFELMAGAVLVQNTTWVNADRSLQRLRDAGVLDPFALLAVGDPDAAPHQAQVTGDDPLAGLIRASGFMTGKARALRALASWLTGPDGVRADRMTDAELRAALLSVRGVGPETADVIALFGYDRQVFVWDSYARRMLAATGHPVRPGYEATRRVLDPLFRTESFTSDELREFHGLIIEAGKHARRAGGWAAHAERLGLVPGSRTS